MTTIKKKALIELTIAFFGSMLGLFGVICFNQYVMMSVPLSARMVLMVMVYWLIAVVPIAVMLVSKDKLSDYGFSKEKVGIQILLGVVIGIIMSAVLTLVPHLAGFGYMVDSGKRYSQAWQFIYEFGYCIGAVGIVEEFVFRGCIYSKVEKLFDKEWVAVLISSVLFGLFHIFSGNIVQIFMTAIIGALLCLARLRMKRVSTLSLIIAHGVYDALITVFASFLLK